MLENTGTRRRSPAWMLISMLGIAVFLWGLHYKLSLYHVDAARRAAPAAKLLSQKERPATALKVACLSPGNRPLPVASGKSLSKLHTALLAHAGALAANGQRLLGMILPLRPGAPHGRFVTQSTPRAPPVAV